METGYLFHVPFSFLAPGRYAAGGNLISFVRNNVANPKIYTPEQKSAALAALRANAGCIKATATQLDIPPSTLRRWRNEAGEKPDKNAEVAVEKLAAQLRRVALQMLGHLQSEERLANTNIRDLAISFGIMMDKLENLDSGNREDGALDGLMLELQMARARQAE